MTKPNYFTNALGFNIAAKSFDPGHSARSAQNDLGQNFLPVAIFLHVKNIKLPPYSVNSLTKWGFYGDLVNDVMICVVCCISNIPPFVTARLTSICILRRNSLIVADDRLQSSNFEPQTIKK